MVETKRYFFKRNSVERSPVLEMLCFFLMVLVLLIFGFLHLPFLFAHTSSFSFTYYSGGLTLTGVLFLLSLILNARQKSFYCVVAVILLLAIIAAGIFFYVGVILRNDSIKLALLFTSLGLVLGSGLLSFLGLFLCKTTSDKLLCFSVLFLLASQIIFPQISEKYKRKSQSRRLVCMSHLKMLAMVCHMCHEENNSWPDHKNWCDLLHQEWDIEMEGFQCPKDLFGPCSYAMNDNIPADANDLPPDLVLLFESTPGWNQVGGADDVITDRHGKPGANIAFADGHVEFVKPETIPTLRWTIER
jgi:prepilin-type processing-associated H-X9-DG protein